MKKPYIIAVINQKGGCGKTTISLNLAHAFALDGFKVLVGDNDPQGSTRKWVEDAKDCLFTVVAFDKNNLQQDIKKIDDNFDIIIIDGAPQIQALSIAVLQVADFALIPVQTSKYDIDSSVDYIQIIKAKQKAFPAFKAAFVLNRVIKNTNISEQAIQQIKKHDLPLLKSYTTQKVVYMECAEESKTVFDFKKKNKLSKSAILEINNIKNELLKGFIQ
jgi:chromosome partitioning protein